jgi:pSer/pThr/pTyr-binding forkhead associated (FHA) protein
VNPSELTLLILRLGFLLLLWFFVFGVVYALRSDLFGNRVRKLQPEAVSPFPGGVPAQPAPPARPANVQPAPVSTLPQGANTATVGLPKATVLTASRLVITDGARAGQELPLGREPLTIGRSGESGLIVRDDYTSTHHARLLLWNDEWMIQDLDSTNGTYLDGKRVNVPTQVPLNTPIKIGSTTFELRR